MEKPKYDLAEDIVRVMDAKGPMSAKELLIHVSGTRPEVSKAVAYMYRVGLLVKVDQGTDTAYARFKPAPKK